MYLKLLDDSHSIQLFPVQQQTVTLETYQPDLPGSSKTKWWKAMTQDGLLSFNVGSVQPGVSKIIAVCARQYDEQNNVTPVDLYKQWLDGQYNRNLLMVHETDVVSSGPYGVSIPVSTGMYLAFLAEKEDGAVVSAYGATHQYTFKYGSFTMFGDSKN